ncbi:MAG: VOC family protein [Sphingomonadales bacterium]
MKIGKISQIAISVKSLEAAKAFYGETLGFQFLFEAPPQMAFFDIDGIRLLIGEAKEVIPNGPILYFSVEDIEATYKTLEEKGVACERAPQMTHKTEASELWLAVFKDPDGHTLALMEEKAI